MAFSIAISGKGGTGKTTISALMVRCLIGKSPQAVLAVDADPNACLGLALGIEPGRTVSDIRDEVLNQKTAPGAGINRLEQFEYGAHQVLTEAEGFDLLTMGRPEGPGCYCSANNIIRKFMDELSGTYGYVVNDNEAGMEHLSRRTTNNVDVLAIVAEPTVVGIKTARRIIQLTDALPINVKEIGIIWNKTDTPPAVNGVDVLGCVPVDEAVFRASMKGTTVFDLPDDNSALLAIQNIVEHKVAPAAKRGINAKREPIVIDPPSGGGGFARNGYTKK